MPVASRAVNTSHEFRAPQNGRTPAIAKPPCLTKERAMVLHLLYCLHKARLLPLYKKERPHFTLEKLEQWMISYVCRLENVLGMETAIPPGNIAAIVEDAVIESDKSSLIFKLRLVDAYEIAPGGFTNVESLLNRFWEENFSTHEMMAMCECAEKAHEDVLKQESTHRA